MEGSNICDTALCDIHGVQGAFCKDRIAIFQRPLSGNASQSRRAVVDNGDRSCEHFVVGQNKFRKLGQDDNRIIETFILFLGKSAGLIFHEIVQNTDVCGSLAREILDAQQLIACHTRRAQRSF